MFGLPSFGQIAQGFPGGMAPNPGATPVEQEQYRAGWMDVLSRPEVRAGLLQFGLQAMQPVPIQQTGPGALAGAVGAGAEAYDTSIKAQAAEAQQGRENARADESLEIQRSQVDATLAGQQNQAEMSAAGDAAALERVRTEIQGRADIAKLPPNEQELIAEIASKLSAAPPVTSYSDPSWNAVDVARDIVERARPTGATPPTGAPPPAPGAGAPTNSPPIPPNLVGKNPGWNARTQRWQLQDGSVYNQQGVPTS